MSIGVPMTSTGECVHRKRVIRCTHSSLRQTIPQLLDARTANRNNEAMTKMQGVPAATLYVETLRVVEVGEVGAVHTMKCRRQQRLEPVQ